MGDVEIGVDEYVETGLKRMGYGSKGGRFYEKLEQLCCLEQGEDYFFFLTAGAAIDEDLKPSVEGGDRLYRFSQRVTRFDQLYPYRARQSLLT